MSALDVDNIEVWPETFRHYQAGSFQLTARNLYSAGALSGELRPHGPLVQRFVARYTFPPKADLDWRELSGLISSLRGLHGKIRVGDYGRRLPAYNIRQARAGNLSEQAFSDGTLFSDGTGFEEGGLPAFCNVDAYAERGSRTLVLRGLPASLAPAFYRGDLFEIRPNGAPATHAHLYEVVRQAQSNADGEARVYFEPPLRATVRAGDQVALHEPTTLMRLAADNEGEIQRDAAEIGRLGLSFIEILPRTVA